MQTVHDEMMKIPMVKAFLSIDGRLPIYRKGLFSDLAHNYYTTRFKPCHKKTKEKKNKTTTNNNKTHTRDLLYDGSGYLHDCRNSSDTKRLLSRQQFLMPKSLYTRLQCIKYKSVIYTTAVSHTKKFIYTAAVHQV